MRTLFAAVALFGLLAAPSAAATDTVTLRGTAYEFNTQTVIPGATIRVAEFPSARTTTRPDGSYALKVQDAAKVTPYIEADGYHTIYLQTFITAGGDVANVNFQTPSTTVYQALASLLNVPLDANGDVTSCAIVSTFSTRNIRDLNYRQFRAYGAHGVAGATAFGVPQLPDPVYFNAQVIPDPSQPSSSDDGGVIWTNVPAGTYTIHGRSPTTKFASFTATCAPGRVVNANPPWGLHELGKANPTRIVARWAVDGSRTKLESLRITRTPRDSTVRVRCLGRGCAAKSKVGTTFRAGQTFEVRVTAPAYNGTVVEFPIKASRTPRPKALCMPLGTTTLQPTCPSS
jgi:hypothetical protein